MIDNNYSVDGQMSLMDLDPDTWFGKTSMERCPQESPKERTSKSSSRKSSKSSKQMPMMCLYLKTADGPKSESSTEWVTMDNPFPWLGGYTMHSTGAYHNAEKGWLSLPTSTDSPLGGVLLDPQYRREAESTESDSSERDPGTGCRPEVQPQSQSVSGNTGESGQEGQSVTADSERSTGESDIEWVERELFGNIE